MTHQILEIWYEVMPGELVPHWHVTAERLLHRSCIVLTCTSTFPKASTPIGILEDMADQT